MEIDKAATDDHEVDSPSDAEMQERITRLEATVAELSSAKEPVDPENPTLKAELSATIQTEDKPGRLPWLIADVISEFRATIRMFFDVRYHVAWSTRVVALGLLILIFTSQWWFALANITFIGPLLDKVICLLLAFVMFKSLNREARRYMEWKKRTRNK